MNKRVALPIQIALFAVLFGVAILMWFGRDRVTALYHTAMGTEQVEQDRRRGPPKRAAPVVVERVREMANDVTIEAIATAQANKSVTLFPKTSGEIVEIAIEAGERVREGDVILRLNAQMATLAVTLARSKLDDAERQLARAESLLESNVNSRARVQDAANLVEQAKLELEQAEESLSERILKAPFDGVVGLARVQLGDRVTPETPITTLDDRSTLYVEVQVAEQYLARLKVGQSIVARSPSFAERSFEGTVTKIDSRVDVTSRAMMIHATIDNDADLLRPGMSFAVQLALSGRDYPAVPELAVQWLSGESFVWMVRDNTARRVVVRSVKRLSSYMLVDAPLAPGDLVIVEGVQRLREGIPVTFTAPLSATGES